MSDYQQTDYDGSYYERELRRREFSRNVKKRRRKAVFTLVIICIVTIGAAICLAFGIKELSSLNFKSKGNNYVEDAPSIRLSVCYNEYASGPENIESAHVDNQPINENIGSEQQISNSDINNSNDSVTNSYASNAYQPVYDKGLIIIDAGHGGEDGGASCEFATESELNLEIAYWAKEELMSRGYMVYMTRIDDTFVGLNARANLANNQDSALAMVSIHQNAYPEDTSVCGVESHTYDRDGCKELGELLSKHVAESVGIQDRGVYFHSNLVVTSKTTMPSVILECGYLTNDEEAMDLTRQDYQINIARGIANAIDEFINKFY